MRLGNTLQVPPPQQHQAVPRRVAHLTGVRLAVVDMGAVVTQDRLRAVIPVAVVRIMAVPLLVAVATTHQGAPQVARDIQAVQAVVIMLEVVAHLLVMVGLRPRMAVVGIAHHQAVAIMQAVAVPLVGVAIIAAREEDILAAQAATTQEVAARLVVGRAVIPVAVGNPVEEAPVQGVVLQEAGPHRLELSI